jgi:hypothetical protein
MSPIKWGPAIIILCFKNSKQGSISRQIRLDSNHAKAHPHLQ